MIDLLTKDLRVRDIRKLVEPSLHEVIWEDGSNKSSEWVMASFEDETHRIKLVSWFKSKGIGAETDVLATDTAWSDVKVISWSSFCQSPEDFLSTSRALFIDRWRL